MRCVAAGGTQHGFRGLLLASDLELLLRFYLMILFQIIGDLFRDKELSGWWKAIWIVALVFVPFLSALIYLIVRGRGMAERQAGEVRRAQAATDSYIKEAAGRGNPTDQIATAKGLLDDGTITAAEFDQLKAAALA
jgi:Phospholipase_D-nuclease N-terminal